MHDWNNMKYRARHLLHQSPYNSETGRTDAFTIANTETNMKRSLTGQSSESPQDRFCCFRYRFVTRLCANSSTIDLWNWWQHAKVDYIAKVVVRSSC